MLGMGGHEQPLVRNVRVLPSFFHDNTLPGPRTTRECELALSSDDVKRDY